MLALIIGVVSVEYLLCWHVKLFLTNYRQSVPDIVMIQPFQVSPTSNSPKIQLVGLRRCKLPQWCPGRSPDQLCFVQSSLYTYENNIMLKFETVLVVFREGSSHRARLRPKAAL